MSLKKMIVLAALASGAFALGYSALAIAYPSPAPYGRAQYHGYFTNASDSSGDFVLQNTHADPPRGYAAFAPSMNSASEFIAEITSRLSGSTWDRTGAAFIIQTMIGSARNKPPTAAQLNTWKSLVNTYGAGTGGASVNWNTNYCFTLNTYYQRDRNSSSTATDDDAFYDDSGCDPAVVFTRPDGKHYVIRRQCANPVGILYPLIAPGPTFAVQGTTGLDDPSPAPGDTIHFTHYVKNIGPSSTSPATITWWAVDSLTNVATRGPTNVGVLPVGQKTTPVYTEPYTVPLGALPGSKICRRTDWSPTSSVSAGRATGPTVCATVVFDFGLTPNVTSTITDSSGAIVPGGVAEPGDNVSFTYSVKNAGPTVSELTTCTIYGANKAGYYTAPTPNDKSGPALPVATGCPRIFAVGTVTLGAPEVIPPASIVANATICRTLVVDPSSFGGGPKSFEACVAIGAKPYLRVYGGDVSVGGGFDIGTADNCVRNNAAAIVSWNREAGGAFAAAGVQYAALAMSTIFDFSTALGNTGGATTPSGLAFANVGKPAGGDFGGKFGSVSCMLDYYSNRPATAPNPPGGNNINIAPVPTGVYGVNGPTTIGGVLPAGSNRQIVIYVHGDVHITSDIKYAGNWTAAQTPLFELIVEGNIYIDSGVREIAGLFVAEPDGASGGTIYTCNNDPDGTLYGACNFKLTINGAFVANEVDFLRTNGSQNQGVANETAAAGHAAEVFNYSPALWMAIPPGQPTNTSYDSVTSLPPIL